MNLNIPNNSLNNGYELDFDKIIRNTIKIVLKSNNC